MSALSLNRTRVELKRRHRTLTKAQKISLNRTRVELKHDTDEQNPDGRIQS